MKHTLLSLLLVALTFSLAFSQDGHMPPNSFYLGNGIWANKNKPDYTVTPQSPIPGESKVGERTTSGCGCSLYDVFAYGHVADGNLMLTNSSGYDANMTPTAYNLDYGGYNYGYFGFFGTAPILQMADPFSIYKATYHVSPLTANRLHDAPDEDGTYVVHNTNMPLTVYWGNNSVTIEGDQVVLSHSGVVQMTIGHNSDNNGGVISSKGRNSYYSVSVHADSMGANADVFWPSYPCRILGNLGGSDAQGLIGATSMTITHGLGFIPKRVFPIITSALPAEAIRVTSKTLTTFTIEWADPITATVSVDWQAAP